MSLTVSMSYDYHTKSFNSHRSEPRKPRLSAPSCPSRPNPCICQDGIKETKLDKPKFILWEIGKMGGIWGDLVGV
jgi:hypothetical protein